MQYVGLHVISLLKVLNVSFFDKVGGSDGYEGRRRPFKHHGHRNQGVGESDKFASYESFNIASTQTR